MAPQLGQKATVFRHGRNMPDTIYKVLNVRSSRHVTNHMIHLTNIPLLNWRVHATTRMCNQLKLLA